MLFQLVPRLVLLELIKVAALTLVALSALLTLGGAMLEAARQGLDPMTVLMLMPYLVPPTLPYTIPTCLLFACTFVYSRMAANVEIIALKAGGINALHVVWPAILFSTVSAAAVIGMTDKFIPACNRKFARLIYSDLQSNIYGYLKQFGALVEPDFPYEIYVRDVHGDRLISPIFKHRSGDGSYDLIVQAAEATLHVTKPEGKPVEEAIVVIRLIDGIAINKGSKAHINEHLVEMPLPKAAKNKDDRVESLDYRGCLKKAQARQLEVQRRNVDLILLATDANLGGAPEQFAAQVDRNREQASKFERKAREARAEVHMRIAQSLIGIAFVLIGCPIGILFQRRDFLHTSFVCFLPIITGYYPLMVLAFNIFKEGTLESLLVLWAPLVLMVVCALPFLWRVLRY